MIQGKEQINTDSDDDRTQAIITTTESEAYQRIEDEFGFYPVRLYYLPEGMAFYEIDIDTVMQNALMTYEGLDGEVITYIMYMNYRTSSAGIDVEDVLLDEYTKEVGGEVLLVKEYLVEENQAHRYVVTYEYQSVYYFLQLINVEEEEARKVLTNLFFS